MKMPIKLGIIAGVIIAISFTIIIFSQMEVVQNNVDQNELEQNEVIPKPIFSETVIVSGPFQINKPQYKLGESIFFRAVGVDPNEKGQISFLRPKNATHYIVYEAIPFDGSLKTDFNQYFKPGIAGLVGICSSEDLVGTWVIVFRGVPYENISFEIINEILSGSEAQYEPVC